MEHRDQKLYKIISSHVEAYKNTLKSGNREWTAKHKARIEQLVHNYMPSGSGIDSGTKIDLDASDGHHRLVFNTAFHHMDEHGGYSGWTEHKVLVTPALRGIEIRFSGRDRNQIKEYLHSVFHDALTRRVADR